MKNKIVILMALVLIAFPFSVSAVNTPEHASFTFKLNHSLSEGQWSLNIVPLSLYRSSDSKATEIFSEFRDKYFEAKSACGLSSDFTYRIES